MTTGWRNAIFLPVTPSYLSQTPEGLFELTRCPSRVVVLPRALLLQLQRNKDTVWCAARGVPRTVKNKIVRLLKT